jgi:EAL domain-containing protein (putative c-di-GMP-specific phosphodiesterase class I)
VVAEGAELPAEVDVLGNFDCDLVQGFVFSPPVTPDKAPLVADCIEREARQAQCISRRIV